MILSGGGEEARKAGLRPRTLGSSRRPFSVEIHRLPLGPKTVVACGIAGAFAPREDVGQAAQPVASAGDLGLACLRRNEIRVGAAQCSSNLANFLIGPALAGCHQRGGRVHVQASPARDRQRLRHQEHVLGHAGHCFPVVRDAWIRPATGSEHVRPRDIDAGADRANARAIGRQTSKRVGFGENSLGREHPGQKHQGRSHAPCARPHTTPSGQKNIETAALSEPRYVAGEKGGARRPVGALGGP